MTGPALISELQSRAEAIDRTAPITAILLRQAASELTMAQLPKIAWFATHEQWCTIEPFYPAGNGVCPKCGVMGKRINRESLLDMLNRLYLIHEWSIET